MRRRRGIAAEEPTSLAGWLFADLFLALVVVGLGSVWITQSSAAPPPPTTTTTTTTTTTPDVTPPESTTTTTTLGPVPFQLSCEEMFIGPETMGKPVSERNADIRQLIEAAKAERGWDPIDAKPAFVIVYAGHNNNPAVGAAEARKVADRLRSDSDLTDLFGAVELRSGGASQVEVNGKVKRIGLSPSRVGVLVYFVYQGQVRQEDCTL